MSNRKNNLDRALLWGTGYRSNEHDVHTLSKWTGSRAYTGDVSDVDATFNHLWFVLGAQTSAVLFNFVNVVMCWYNHWYWMVCCHRHPRSGSSKRSFATPWLGLARLLRGKWRHCGSDVSAYALLARKPSLASQAVQIQRGIWGTNAPNPCQQRNPALPYDRIFSFLPWFCCLVACSACDTMKCVFILSRMNDYPFCDTIGDGEDTRYFSGRQRAGEHPTRTWGKPCSYPR